VPPAEASGVSPSDLAAEAATPIFIAPGVSRAARVAFERVSLPVCVALVCLRMSRFHDGSKSLPTMRITLVTNRALVSDAAETGRHAQPIDGAGR
jgi:hypothetical protein